MLTITTHPLNTTLATLQQARDTVGVTTADQDTTLLRFLQASSDRIQAACRRVFPRAAYTETIQGSDHFALVLSRRPVVAVSSVSIDGLIDTTYTLDDRDAGILRRTERWPMQGLIGFGMAEYFDARNAVKQCSVSYTAGYLLPSDDVIQRETISVASADKSFNDSAGGFPLLVAGDRIDVSGFATAANQGVFTVVTRTASKVTVSESVTTEAAGPPITIRVSTLPGRATLATLELVRYQYLGKDKDPDLLERRVGDLAVRYREMAPTGEQGVGALPGTVLMHLAGLVDYD